jgi:hypothetical protein
MLAETVAELEKALREQKRMEELNLMFDIAVELNMYPSRYIFYICIFKLLPHCSRHLLHVQKSFKFILSCLKIHIPSSFCAYKKSLIEVLFYGSNVVALYSLDLTAVLHVHCVKI